MMTLGRSHTASDTSGTEGWLRSAFAADATSATKPTRDGLDSGGNGRPIFYLDPIAAMLRWHAVAFLFRREPVLQRRVHRARRITRALQKSRLSASRLFEPSGTHLGRSRRSAPRHLCITPATCADPTPACAAASIPA